MTAQELGKKDGGNEYKKLEGPLFAVDGHVLDGEEENFGKAHGNEESSNYKMTTESINASNHQIPRFCVPCLKEFCPLLQNSLERIGHVIREYLRAKNEFLQALAKILIQQSRFRRILE